MIHIYDAESQYGIPRELMLQWTGSDDYHPKEWLHRRTRRKVLLAFWAKLAGIKGLFGFTRNGRQYAPETLLDDLQRMETEKPGAIDADTETRFQTLGRYLSLLPITPDTPDISEILTTYIYHDLAEAIDDVEVAEEWDEYIDASDECLRVSLADIKTIHAAIERAEAPK